MEGYLTRLKPIIFIALIILSLSMVVPGKDPADDNSTVLVSNESSLEKGIDLKDVNVRLTIISTLIVSIVLYLLESNLNQHMTSKNFIKQIEEELHKLEQKIIDSQNFVSNIIKFDAEYHDDQNAFIMNMDAHLACLAIPLDLTAFGLYYSKNFEYIYRDAMVWVVLFISHIILFIFLIYAKGMYAERSIYAKNFKITRLVLFLRKIIIPTPPNPHRVVEGEKLFCSFISYMTGIFMLATILAFFAGAFNI